MESIQDSEVCDLVELLNYYKELVASGSISTKGLKGEMHSSNKVSC